MLKKCGLNKYEYLHRDLPDKVYVNLKCWKNIHKIATNNNVYYNDQKESKII